MKKKSLMQVLKISGFVFVTLLIFASAACSAPPADKGGGGGSGKGGGGKGGGQKDALGMKISAPANASAGDVITINVEPVGDVALTGVVVGADPGGPVGFGETAPYTVNYVIPLDVTGLLTIGAAAGNDAAEEVYQASTVVQVDTGTAVLQSMELRLETVLLQNAFSQKMSSDYYMESQRPYIVGTYSDGVDRNLTSPATGTVYTSQNTNVVRILPDGTFQAVGEGATTVTVTNSGVSHTLQVTVDFVDPDRGTLCGSRCTGYDLVLTYSAPVTLVPEMEVPPNLFYSTTITLPANASEMTFRFNNNSGLPQLGVPRSLVTWELDRRSDSNCSVSFTDNVMPPDRPPYAVQRGKMTVRLPAGGGTCIFTTNIEGLAGKDADKWTITNPAP